MIDPGTIVEGSLAGYLANHLTKWHEHADNRHRELCDILEDINKLLGDFEQYYRNTQAAHVDLKHFQFLSKTIAYIPDSKSRLYVKIFVPTLTVVNVTAPGLLPFNLTLQNWTYIELPEGSSFLLDASNTFSQLTIWEICTNKYNGAE